MSEPAPYYPQTMFATEDEPLPRVMVAPPRYIQGPGVLAHTGRYLGLIDAKRVGVLASSRGLGADAGRVIESLNQHDIDSIACTFGGESSLPEIDAQVADLSDSGLDALLAVGGGKCVDAGKCIAYRLGVPVVVIPTLASNDAPTSAVSVIYTTDGVSSGAEFFPSNPALVIVDTEVVAKASERYLVAGMGDAMATWYEARVCLNNADARSTVGARPTLAAGAIGEICAKTLFAEGEAAARAVANDEVTEALEKVVEANTLLSGLGFESGGLAIAHPVAQSYTTIPRVHAEYLHGEMVAMGTLVQLVIEGGDEATRVAEFFARVGLPVHLGQLSLSPDDEADLDGVVDAVMAQGTIRNMPVEVTPALVKASILEAHALGLEVNERVGDAAYRKLHA